MILNAAKQGFSSAFAASLTHQILDFPSWATRSEIRITFDQLKLFKSKDWVEMPAPADPDVISVHTLVAVLVRGIVESVKIICPSMRPSFAAGPVARKRTRKELD
jgi:hypothetical protein